MTQREGERPRASLLRLLHHRTSPKRDRIIPAPSDEFLQLAEVLLAELSRPLTSEERSHGWSVALQRQMRRWVKTTRDRYRKGLIPAQASGPISFALPMTLDSLSCKLIELDSLLDQKIMAATGEGADQVRDDLEELAGLSDNDPATAEEIRAAIREYDQARSQRQQGNNS
jgi:hypothetical protein